MYFFKTIELGTWGVSQWLSMLWGPDLISPTQESRLATDTPSYLKAQDQE